MKKINVIFGASTFITMKDSKLLNNNIDVIVNSINYLKSLMYLNILLNKRESLKDMEMLLLKLQLNLT